MGWYYIRAARRLRGKWAVTLFILANHGAVPADATLGPQNAASVAFPRR